MIEGFNKKPGARMVPANSQTWYADPRDSGIDFLLNVTQACQVLGICERLLRKLVAEDRIDYLKIGRSIRFSRSKLEKWIEEGGTK